MTSEVVELVTNDDQHFFVHKAILTSQSTSFQNTPERTVDLSEWNSDTVARLVEFLYCRNYDYPDPTPLEPRAERSLGENLPPAQADSEVENPRRPLTPLPDCLGSSLALDMAPRTDVERLHPFDPPHYDFGGILLAHAKVYSLASSKSIIPLQTLALRRLLLVLLRLHPLQPQSHILKNIVDFTRYVYASNLSVNTDFLVSSEEPLRKLASQLIALNFAVFHSQPDAVELIAQGGDLVTDVMAKVCRRLSDPVGVTWTAGPTEEVMGPREELMGPREEVRGPREEVRYISGIKVFTSLGQTLRIDWTRPNAGYRLYATAPHLPIALWKRLARAAMPPPDGLALIRESIQCWPG